MQPELFQNLGDEPPRKGFHPSLFPHRYLRVRVAYEDMVFFSLSLLLVLLAGFCLGVERGKRLSAWAAPMVPTASSPPRVEEPAASMQVAASPGVRNPDAREGSYAIQCASFRDSKVAEEQAARLMRQGFDARVVKQGRYYELRVVGYRARAEALGALPALKKRYQDGFVKRLSSG